MGYDDAVEDQWMEARELEPFYYQPLQIAQVPYTPHVPTSCWQRSKLSSLLKSDKEARLRDGWASKVEPQGSRRGEERRMMGSSEEGTAGLIRSWEGAVGWTKWCLGVCFMLLLLP